jgi:DNA helicase IV
LSEHPELSAEQAYVDHAYGCLESARDRAKRLRSIVEVGRGGTEQARWEREVIEENIATRLSQLDLGESSLVFGRLDTDADHGQDTFYIGRMSVADDDQEPVVVDWRAPISEAFYRATGPQPMGLARRRHFTSRGRTLLNLEDELFGDAVHGDHGGIRLADDDRIQGHGALIRALETSRTGKLGDIVATIQGEQDEIIRSELGGVLVVQGGPGTGKTVVALHRAAYLLYTHRFPLEGQGVLVLGPNRLFLGYIDQVLPSLGEAGVELGVLADLVERERIEGEDDPKTLGSRATTGWPRSSARRSPTGSGRCPDRCGSASAPRRWCAPSRTAGASWPTPTAATTATTPAGSTSSSSCSPRSPTRPATRCRPTTCATSSAGIPT